MRKYMERFGQAFNKLRFCTRVSADPLTWWRLLVNSKRLNYYQKKNTASTSHKTGAARGYRIRWLSGVLPLYLRTFAGDIRIFYEVFWERVYWLPATFLRDPRVIVDAGANVGMTGVYFSVAYPGARVYCIEPDPDNVRVLKMNLRRQLEQGSVVLAAAALYDHDGWVNLAGEGWAYNHAVGKETEEGARVPAGMRVPAITPETMIRQWGLEKIDLLKIDIEGAEDNLFRGALEWLEIVETILLEIHSPEGEVRIRDILIQKGFYWRRWEGAGGTGLRGAGGVVGSGDPAAELAGAVDSAGVEGSLFLASRKQIPN